MKFDLFQLGRDEGDRIVRSAGNEWWEAARDAMPGLLLPAVERVAKNNAVDSGYVLWTLLEHPRSWRDYDQSRLLRAAVGLYLRSRSRSIKQFPYTVPDDLDSERRVNKALKDLAQWAKNTLPSEMGKVFVPVLRSQGEELKAFIFKSEGERVSSADAKVLIVDELPLRLKDHPDWFYDAPVMKTLSKHVLGS